MADHLLRHGSSRHKRGSFLLQPALKPAILCQSVARPPGGPGERPKSLASEGGSQFGSSLLRMNRAGALLHGAQHAGSHEQGPPTAPGLACAVLCGVPGSQACLALLLLEALGGGGLSGAEGCGAVRGRRVEGKVELKEQRRAAWATPPCAWGLGLWPRSSLRGWWRS